MSHFYLLSYFIWPHTGRGTGEKDLININFAAPAFLASLGVSSTASETSSPTSTEALGSEVLDMQNFSYLHFSVGGSMASDSSVKAGSSLPPP